MAGAARTSTVAPSVNGVAKDCGNMPLPAKVNGYYYFDCSAGTYSYASIYWW